MWRESVTAHVTIPSRNLFISADEYSATLLHELTHCAEFRIALRRLALNSEAVRYWGSISA